MASMIGKRLAQMGLALPDAPAPAGSYAPWKRSGDLIFISGQLPPLKADGVRPARFAGRLGEGVVVADGQDAARLAALAVLSQLREACTGDLDRVGGCVRIGGFVACTPDFTQHPQVVNGASDLIAEALGEDGTHARAAVGVQSLPMGACVEIEAVFEVSAR